MRRLAVLPVLTLLGACGASDDTPTSTTSASASVVTSAPGVAPTCTSRAGIDFTTDLDSCTEAIEKGIAIARSVGGLTVDQGADIVFSTICQTIQGDITTTYGEPTDLEMATLLDAGGVCPGNLDMLVPR